MRFGKFYSHSFKKEFQQINIINAEKLYNEGKDIYVHPCNMCFDNVWQTPCKININDNFWGAEDFRGRISDYKYYNCDNERGKYPNFFIAI